MSKKRDFAKNKVYAMWVNIKGRCLNKEHSRYSDYGGRGIGLSKKFLDFISFYNYIVTIPNYSDWLSGNKLSIDRIDNNKGYKMGNLRFVTKREQMANTRRKNNSTGIRGIDYYDRISRYIVRLSIDNVRYNLGCFKDIEDAISAKEKFILDKKLTPAHGNKI